MSVNFKKDVRHKSKDETGDQEPNPCEACGAETGQNLNGGDGAVVWEHRLCYPCCAAFNAEAPTYGDLDQQGEKDSVGFYKRFVTMWIRSRRKAKGVRARKPDTQEQEAPPPAVIIEKPDLAKTLEQNFSPKADL